MAIQRWDPLRDVMQLQQKMNRLFEEVLSRSPFPGASESIGGSGWRPAMDLFEDSGRYVLRADLPGVVPDAVEIQVEDGQLVLRGERKADAAVPQEAYLRIERPSGRFAVQVSLPTSVDRDRIAATHVNGVLEIVLPKKQSAAATRVEVRGG